VGIGCLVHRAGTSCGPSTPATLQPSIPRATRLSSSMTGCVKDSRSFGSSGPRVTVTSSCEAISNRVEVGILMIVSMKGHPREPLCFQASYPSAPKLLRMFIGDLMMPFLKRSR